MSRPAFVVGVGMTKFEKPLTRAWDYPDMGREAASAALIDGGLCYDDVQAVCASYCYGEPTSGQRVAYELGLTGIPIFNTNNNCSSGSSALMIARLLIQSGAFDCVLAVGFEKMERGLSERYTDRASPVERHRASLIEMGADVRPVTPKMNNMTSDVIKMFAYAANEHSRLYGTTPDQYARIAHKNRKHGSNNRYACFQSEISLQQVAKQPLLYPITTGMSAMTADGGAAAILCSEQFMHLHSLEKNAVEIVSQHMVTDIPSSFGKSFRNLCGVEMSRLAGQRCLRDAAMSIRDVDVLEVHDCFSCNELFMYEALGMCGEGKGGGLIDEAEWVKNAAGGEVCVVGNQWVVNPSGGLESKGHPIGATGLAQCAELNWQLRGVAGKRQVDGCRVAMQHNFGLGSAAVVTLYQKYKPEQPLSVNHMKPPTASKL